MLHIPLILAGIVYPKSELINNEERLGIKFCVVNNIEWILKAGTHLAVT